MKWFALVFLAAFLACHSEDNTDKLPKTKVDMRANDDDMVIPASLWNEFENSFPALTESAPLPAAEGGEGKKEEGGEKKEKKEKTSAEDKELLKRRPVIDRLAFTTLLIEKTPDSLGGENYELTFGPNGGTLDFSRYVNEKKKGTFFLKVKYDGEMDPKFTKVYFLSNAKVHEVGGKDVGSGCNKYFDITKYWSKMMKDEGLVLNTSGLRHLAITTGTFFFVAPAGHKLRMGHLTITDSRHKDLLCEVVPKL